MAKKPSPKWNDDAAKKMATIIFNAFRKSEKKAFQAKRAAKTATSQMRKQGKKDLTRIVNDAVKGGQKQRRAAEVQKRVNTSIEYSRRQIKGGGSKAADMATRAEATASKGTTLRKGKEVPVSKKKVAEMRTEAGYATSQAKKGNAAKREKQADLLKRANEARKSGNSELSNKLRSQYRDHVKKYGRFS